MVMKITPFHHQIITDHRQQQLSRATTVLPKKRNMGRTQVLRNQRLGRPGQKGRGRGERMERPRKETGENAAWRVSLHDGVDVGPRAELSIQEELDEDLLALESHGNYHGSPSFGIAMADDDDVVLSGSFLGALTKIDVQQIDRGLSTLSLSEILGLPPHLTELLEDQSRHVVGATLRHTYNHDEPVVGSCNDYGQASVAEAKTVGTKSNEESKETKENTEDDDEDDMESWLDSVIA
jgi:hypothetical protein